MRFWSKRERPHKLPRGFPPASPAEGPRRRCRPFQGLHPRPGHLRCIAAGAAARRHHHRRPRQLPGTRRTAATMVAMARQRRLRNVLACKRYGHARGVDTVDHSPAARHLPQHDSNAATGQGAQPRPTSLTAVHRWPAGHGRWPPLRDRPDQIPATLREIAAALKDQLYRAKGRYTTLAGMGRSTPRSMLRARRTRSIAKTRA